MFTTGFNLLMGAIVISVGLYIRYTTKSGEEDIYGKKKKQWGKK